MINIKGIIGSEQGQYSLLKLISAVGKEPADQPIYININSEGGDGGLAFDMLDYLRGLKRPIITECSGMCASAASILFLAGDKRIAGCPIMIHNPWMDARGDSEHLKSVAEWIGGFEKRTEKFYAEKTKLDIGTLSSLMRAETYMSPSQAVEFGFATKSKQIAKALITNSNQNQKNMTDKKKKASLFRQFMAMLAAEGSAKMLDLSTADGETIVIDREDGEPQVGDAASPDGSFVMPDGSTIVVAEGAITEIIPSGPDETEQLRAENTQLKEQVAAMKATVKTQEESAQLNAIKMAGGTEWLTKQCSTYRPAARKVTMAGKSGETDSRSSRTSQKLAEIKKERGIE